MKTVAYSSPFVPAEWIAAHGLRPHRLRLRLADDRPLPAPPRGICPYVGALLDAALAGLDAAALVLTTVCDQMRYAAALLEIRGNRPLFLLNVPSTWQTPAARKLYLDELRRLGRFLVDLGGKAPDGAELARVMLAFDRARNVDSICHPERSEGSGVNSEEILRSAQDDRAANVPAIVRPPATSAGIPLAVLGGPLLETDCKFFDILERAGGRVALDATEDAQRTMPRPFEPSRVASDPLPELADAYFDGIFDAFRRPNGGLYEWLGRQLAARRVRGIVFRRYLWCDLWHGEVQRLREWTTLPVLEIDVGPDDASAPNRIQGRIEAFLEMLSTAGKRT